MDLEQKSIERIKMASEMSLYHYGLPLVCTYSGGKDSDVMLELFKRSGIPFEVHNSHTTADAPQTVRHIRETFRALETSGIKATITMPQITMWRLIVKKKFPPCRTQRYCCEWFKENSNPNRFIATGVRWAESNRRRNRQEIEPASKKDSEKIMLMNDNDKKRLLTERCAMKSNMILNPIVDWPDKEVWDFYWNECKSHNPLYKMGYLRVGCIGCPMAGKKRWKEFADFPGYKKAYIRAFSRMLEKRKADGLTQRWKTGEEVFLWWMEDDTIPGQMSFEDFPEIMPESRDVLRISGEV